MNKQEFLKKLKKKLSGVPQHEIEERINFYSEMIDDRIEEGLTEEDAVAQIVSAESVVARPSAERVAESSERNKRKLKGFEIVLLAIGSPIWVSWLIAVVAVLFSVLVVTWSVVVSLWAICFSLCCCFLVGTLTAVFFALRGSFSVGAVLLGVSLVCAGTAVFAFFGCVLCTKGSWSLTCRFAASIKNFFVKKEACDNE